MKKRLCKRLLSRSLLGKVLVKTSSQAIARNRLYINKYGFIISYYSTYIYHKPLPEMLVNKLDDRHDL